MDTPEKIKKAAETFYQAVIDGMKNRPIEFINDKDMAKAAGISKATFCEYKEKSKGAVRPNFFVIYQLAYVLAKGPPCSLDAKNLQFNRFIKAIEKDNHQVLEKIIFLILDGSVELEAWAAGIDALYKQRFSPQKLSQNS